MQALHSVSLAIKDPLNGIAFAFKTLHRDVEESNELILGCRHS